MVRDLAGLLACELNAEHLALFDDAKNESKQMFTQRIRRSIRRAVHRGWTKLRKARWTWVIITPRVRHIRTKFLFSGPSRSGRARSMQMGVKESSGPLPVHSGRTLPRNRVKYLDSLFLFR